MEHGKPGLTDNQFRGKREYLPYSLPEGSSYLCTDTFEMFVYDSSKRPQGFVAPIETNFRKLTAYNGIISGVANILSINSDATKFDIKSFKYRFIDKSDPENPVEIVKTFEGEIGIPGTTFGSEATVYVYIDKNGNITQSLDIQGGITLYDKILLGNLDPDNTGLFFINSVNSPQTGYDLETTVESLLRRLGGTNLEGCVMSGNNDITIQKTKGTALGLGRGYNSNFNIPNIQTTELSAIVGSELGFIVLGHVDALGEINTNIIFSKEIDSTQYNNNGTLDSVTGSQFTILRLFYFYGSEVLFVYYGNDTYNSLANAELGIGTELFVEHPVTYEATSRGFLIVKGDVSDLSLATDAKFILPNRIRL